MSAEDVIMIKQVLICIGMVPGQIKQTADEIYGMLTAPHRHYHCFDHVMNMMAAYDQVFGETAADEEAPFMAMAILCHDLFWYPGAPKGQCEVASANMCRMLMDKCGLRASFNVNHAPKLQTDLVYDAIIATQHYMGGKVVGHFANQLCDLDLASMGADWDDFVADSEKILKECNGTPKGRAEFLREMIKACDGTLFRTGEGEEAWGVKARSNIDRYCKEHL